MVTSASCSFEVYVHFLSDKYDVTQHPLYKETDEYDERNKLDIILNGEV